MPEPQPLGSARVLRRIERTLAARGLPVPQPDTGREVLSPDEPGHPDFHRRQRVEFAMNRWRAAAPHRYRDATCTHPGIAAWADIAAADEHEAGALLITGPLGTGKTHQAFGALRRIAESAPTRFEAVATTAPDMFALLRPDGSPRGSEEEVRRLARIPLLLLDDVGAEKPSEWTEEATYRILNERYNACRPMVITSNLPVHSATGHDLAARLGGRIASRLAEMATVVPMTGTDRRRPT